MSDIFNVLMVGVGGQGIVLASDILAEAARGEGLEVKKSEIHGMAMRGGPVFSHVRFGRRVFAPVISKGEAQVIFALESMEVLRWLEWAAPAGSVCYLSHTILPNGLEQYPAGVDGEIARHFETVLRISPAKLKEASITPQVENTALLGALSTLLPLPVETLSAAVSALCPKGTAELNGRAFETGRRLATQRTESSHVE